MLSPNMKLIVLNCFGPINACLMTINSALGSKTINFTGVCPCVWACAYVRWIVIRAMKGTVK